MSHNKERKNYKLALYLGLAMSSAVVYGQKKEDKKAEKDKTEKKDSTVTKVKKIDELIKDLNNNESNSSVRFEKQGSGSYSDTYISAIDKDEVDGLVISIKNLIDNVLKTTPTTYTEVTYSSRGGFSLGSYFEEKKSKWTSFLKVEKHTSKSMGILSGSDLQNLLVLLEQAKTKM